jgi:hypothetical protein
MEVKSLKVVKVEAVVGEINFQKNEMIKYLKSWHIDEDLIDLASDYFETAIHGVQDHMEHYELKDE